MNRRARLGAVLAAWLLASAAPLQAQQKHAVLPFEGSHAFRHVLKEHKLKPLTSAAALATVQPDQVVLVVLGDPRGLDEAMRYVGGLGVFRRQGGAVLIASDRTYDRRLKNLGLVVSGRGVCVKQGALGRDPSLVYQGNEDCPVLHGLDRRRGSLFQGLGRGLVTNRPSYLLFYPRQPDSLQPLVGFPPECSDDEGSLHGGGLTFIAGPTNPRERVLVIADRTLFMNGMLALPETDNWPFTWNCVYWLSNGGQRRYALLIEDGQVMSNFDVPLMQLPLPPLWAIDLLLRKAEEENLFNRLILDHIPRERILRYLFLGASVLLVLYVLFRLVRAHHRGETPAPLVAVSVGQQNAEQLPLVAMRTEAAVREGNCYEAARGLARLVFEGAEGERPAAPPRVLHGDRQLRRAVERLWRLAYGTTPTPVAAAEFAALPALASRVRAGLEDGSLR
jgi:hypothetical protein